MKQQIEIFVTGLFVLIQVILAAQSLDSLLLLADQNNLQLQSMHQLYRAALEKAPQVSQMPDPELGVGVFVLAPETRVGPQIARGGVTQMLPWKGLLEARGSAALAMAETHLPRIENRRLALHFELKEAWLQLYRIDKSQLIVSENLKFLRALNRFTLSKVENGSGSAADVLRIQLKTQELEQELLLLENSRIKPIRQINEILARDLNIPVVIKDSLVQAVLPYARDTIPDHLRTSHPMIHLYNRQKDVASVNLKVNALNTRPTFGVGLDYIWVNKRQDVEIPQNGKNILMPRASVQIPLNQSKYEAKAREERIIMEALDTQISDTELQLMRMIDQAASDHTDALLRMDLYDQLTRTTKVTIDLIESEYSATGRRFDELLRMQMELLSYRQKQLDAIVQSHLAVARIERLLAK